jgi:ferredoxin
VYVPLPQIDVLCTHRRPMRREHRAMLARMCMELEEEGLCRPADGAGPLVLLSCGDGDRGGARARSRARRHADSSVEIVHVRLDGPAARGQAQRIVRGALRFAAAAGGAQAPRRGPLAAFARESPLSVVEDRCAGSPRCGICASRCPTSAIQFGAGGRPIVRASACDLCGRCVATCPRGAWGWAYAPWPALLGRLEALLATAPGPGSDEPVALLLSERARPPAPDEPRETKQPAVPWILPLELPSGTLGAGVVLRALELGAARVCAVVVRDSSAGDAGLEAAFAVAHAIGAGDALRIARSKAEALAVLGGRPSSRTAGSPASAMDARCRPDAAPIAERLWRGSAAPEPVSFRAAGAFGAAVTAHAARCTLCEDCTRACPSGALALRRDAAGVALVFDGRRCHGGCGLCARACPYKALTVCDEVRLPAGEAMLVAPRPSACPSCGAPWSGAPAVPALERRYDPRRGNDALRSFLTACPSCRRRKLAASLRTLVSPNASCSAQ